MMLCVSRLNIGVQKKTIIDALEHELNCKCIESLWIWNSSLAFIRVEGIEKLPEKILLKSMYKKGCRTPVVQLSDKRECSFPETTDKLLLQMRFYVLHKVLDDLNPRKSELMEYNRLIEQNIYSLPFETKELNELIEKIYSEADIPVDDFLIKKFDIIHCPSIKGFPYKKYIQLVISFSNKETIKKIIEQDGKVLEFRYLNFVLRTEIPTNDFLERYEEFCPDHDGMPRLLSDEI